MGRRALGAQFPLRSCWSFELGHEDAGRKFRKLYLRVTRTQRLQSWFRSLVVSCFFHMGMSQTSGTSHYWPTELGIFSIKPSIFGGDRLDPSLRELLCSQPQNWVKTMVINDPKPSNRWCLLILYPSLTFLIWFIIVYNILYIFNIICYVPHWVSWILCPKWVSLIFPSCFPMVFLVGCWTRWPPSRCVQKRPLNHRTLGQDLPMWRWAESPSPWAVTSSTRRWVKQCNWRQPWEW